MTYEDHCEETLQKLGDRHERVHRWLDEFARDTYPLVSHRVHRHHEAGIEEVRRKWGDSAAEAARLHILSDVACYGMGNVPTFQQAEAMWGQEVVPHPDGRIEIRGRPGSSLLDLGWGNGWGDKTPEPVSRCDRKRLVDGERHDYSDVLETASGAHLVSCRTCGYMFRYDSGD